MDKVKFSKLCIQTISRKFTKQHLQALLSMLFVFHTFILLSNASHQKVHLTLVISNVLLKYFKLNIKYGLHG